MTYSKKIVLLSRSGYVPERDEDFLRRLCSDGIRLFCVLGADADKWEEALDWIGLDQGSAESHFITTTSLIDESLAEVIEFAQLFDSGEKADVQVLER